MNRDEIRRLYVGEGLSSEEVGRLVGVTGRAVRYHLKAMGLDHLMADRRRTVGVGKEPTNKGQWKPSPKQGRRYITVSGRVVLLARHLMEQRLGRKLRRDEYVHHKDENPLNDSFDNLEVMSASAHTAHHRPCRWKVRPGHDCALHG